jgi:hypothetical protein
MSRLYLSNPCAFFHYHCTRRCGRSRRPAFPAPSVRERDNEIANLGRIRAARMRALTPKSSRRGRDPKRSRLLTILWHCGHWSFSSRTARRGSFGNEPSTVLAEDSALQGLGSADSQRKLRDFGWGGRGRPRARDLGCVPAHPPYWRASASYRPLRAVWAICAWALRGSREIEKTLQRPVSGARLKRNLQA